MPFREISKNKIEDKYKFFVDNHTCDERFLNSSEKNLRAFMMDKFSDNLCLLVDKHAFDMSMGIELYKYLNGQPDFTPYLESNYNFWRFVSTAIIPEIVEQRWGIENKTHFYDGTSHVYAYQIYWYIKLSWQGDETSTVQTLSTFNTDVILNLVDRVGRVGLNPEMYRCLIKEYSTYPKDNRVVKIGLVKPNSLFRVVMIKHLAKSSAVVPEIYEGGIKGYVDMLFNEYKYLKEGK